MALLNSISFPQLYRWPKRCGLECFLALQCTTKLACFLIRKAPTYFPGPGTVYLLTDDEDSSDLPMSLFANEGKMARWYHWNILPFSLKPSSFFVEFPVSWMIGSLNLPSSSAKVRTHARSSSNFQVLSHTSCRAFIYVMEKNLIAYLTLPNLCRLPCWERQ